VVEGVGDHGCEYMTGGIVIVLGATGRNFAAGMSGGLAYVLDRDNEFEINCNKSSVDLVDVNEENDIQQLKSLIEEHFQSTHSAVAKKILDERTEALSHFVKVYPRDYRRVLEERKNKKSVELKIA